MLKIILILLTFLAKSRLEQIEQKRTQERKKVSTSLVFSCLYFELELNKCIQNTKNISKRFTWLVNQEISQIRILLTKKILFSCCFRWIPERKEEEKHHRRKH